MFGLASKTTSRVCGRMYLSDNSLLEIYWENKGRSSTCEYLPDTRAEQICRLLAKPGTVRYPTTGGRYVYILP